MCQPQGLKFLGSNFRKAFLDALASLAFKYLCYVNGISRNQLVRYFFGTNDTSDTSKTASSSNASKTSASVTRLSSY